VEIKEEVQQYIGGSSIAIDDDGTEEIMR